VAILAGYAMQFVLGPVKQRLVVARDMAVYASAGVLVRPSTKTEDEVPRLREFPIVSTGSFDGRDVRSAWAMTTFAAPAVLHTWRRRLSVRGFRKLIRMHGMTCDACFDTRVLGGFSLYRSFPDNRGR
jgi:hypothetical protein